MAVKNRFNNIGSKEWLPFQKSWFVATDTEALYRSNVRFFTQSNEEFPLPKVFYQGKESSLFQKVCKEEGRQSCTVMNEQLMYAILDLRQQYSTVDAYKEDKERVLNLALELYDGLMHRKFLCILLENLEGETFEPIAWDLAKSLSSYYSLKDEKIACFKEGEVLEGGKCYYALYFRKDEKSVEALQRRQRGFLEASLEDHLVREQLGAWQVVKPPRRKPNEILHPAKYPEQLIEQFIKAFTKEGESVFDPMSGTGSTQVAALQSGRNGFGCELSPFFSNIANERCEEAAQTGGTFKIANEDAKKCAELGFPLIDYVITSPPYWDMLNMKGAEYQARRKEKGLQLNYSDDENDLGNVEDYDLFVDTLVEVYRSMDKILKPGAHITIIVKNIKKKGSNYPFAWDLSEKLCEKGWKLLPEFFWCQDDINLAPYGYGNTWVSNTFHQYCLTFQKP